MKVKLKMKKTIWILLDNRNGSRNPAKGIANQFNKDKFEIIEKDLTYTKYSCLPNLIRSKSLLGLDSTSKNIICQPFPDFVISSSRRTAPIARYIKKQNYTTKLFQLGHIGRVGVKDFTMCFAPEHDKHKFKAPNISYTVGCAHLVTKEKLLSAQQEWEEKFTHLPKPLTAVIIGGSIKNKPFTKENATKLSEAIYKLKSKDKGSILLTTSRRTGKEAEDIIVNHLKDIPQYNFLWGSKDKNPFFGFLSCADNIIVTGDSISMCCETTSTSKKVMIFTGHDWLTKKHHNFVKSLYKSKYAIDLLNPNIDNFNPSKSTLNVAKQIADTITSDFYE